jgi:hypothetical protein
MGNNRSLMKTGDGLTCLCLPVEQPKFDITQNRDSKYWTVS